MKGLALASKSLQRQLIQQQLQERRAYNAPLFTREQALRIFKVREVELQLLDELRKLSRRKGSTGRWHEGDEFSPKLYEALMRKHNLHLKDCCRQDQNKKRTNPNQENFVNFLLQIEGKVTGRRCGRLFRAERDHRKLLLRDRVLGPMQVSKILDILVSNEAQTSALAATAQQTQRQ